MKNKKDQFKSIKYKLPINETTPSATLKEEMDKYKIIEQRNKSKNFVVTRTLGNILIKQIFNE